jgi:hypothetical protein
MSLNKFILLLISTLCFTTNVFAASKSRELSVDGNYYASNGESASLINASIGQFVTPQLAIVTSLSLQRNFAGTATTIGVGGKYFFMDGFKGDLVPFAGVGIGLRLQATPTDSNHGSTEYALSGGVAYFLSDSTTLDAKLGLLIFNDASPSATLISAGFSQRF